ncbi:alpha/beta hydrolase fold protein [Leptolyngbya boryana NIES-2135]|jgi:pimeloyl-ACP methyl ester carboxylesterase|uniref:Alpha/beta hydrolase fold protein n=1 Tax=Leptolyngbya boryana NIES-2135 TaxID=1973484 RepID=A0A1Z4JCK0_LEPBY|nr:MULTISPECIES: alpha/beta hydrolase [Leptolyngbya]BAY54403.1 alpha/beta hydrolase fold protein [Leptolyngbya boryana NIES-2135]MBD2370089.1 alpha/beta hydrolase [Leptolyngbya sp. FACHB-161]MBD2376444.1 alpha/beta hydrolase [Leptolyngbya sp. FACHB-238]MBD2400718.1 alpha/beta hydrolase [Leptolyngbya sp. FACHB-239]MBD2407261.1 alpha/beta hydrolase [Leptolyngbya sp. FACHB-402]
MLQFQPPGFRQKNTQTSLGTIAYYTQTEVVERSPIVFLHSFGGGSSAYEWSKVYPVFARQHQIIAPDLLGWGESSHPARDYRAEDYVSSIAEFLPKVTREPAILVASSLSGALAIRVAIQHPDLVKSLFLVCPSGFDDFGEGAGRRIPREIINTPILDRVIYAIGATNEFAVRNFLENFLFVNRDRITPEMVNAYLASARQPNAEYAALAFLRGDLYFDLSRYLPQLTTPTAIVWGEEAQFTDVRLGQQLSDLNERVQSFEVVPDSGVLVALEQPAIVAGLLQEFLSAEK